MAATKRTAMVTGGGLRWQRLAEAIVVEGGCWPAVVQVVAQTLGTLLNKKAQTVFSLIT